MQMTPEKFESLCRVRDVIVKYAGFVKAFKALNEEEYQLLIATLEKSLEVEK